MKELKIYNTCTKKYEITVVTEEVYTAYMRKEWNTHDGNEAFYAHEIQLSSLIGGKDENYENFREFVDEENTPENVVERKILLETAMSKLTPVEKDVIKAIYFFGMTETEYADEIDVSQQMVNKKKARALEKMKIFSN